MKTSTLIVLGVGGLLFYRLLQGTVSVAQTGANAAQSIANAPLDISQAVLNTASQELNSAASWISGLFTGANDNAPINGAGMTPDQYHQSLGLNTTVKTAGQGILDGRYDVVDTNAPYDAYWDPSDPSYNGSGQ